ncbi:MAG: tRNA (adenosine(37)-N6)-dimethylallyltransferase MiaA [Patescibacteria group bacterium]
MKSIPSSKIIVIVGSTASGKSDLGVRIAKQINGEIISADSRQVYKGLDIGSGKITKKEMRGIPHYCLDIASPKKIFTAENFKKYGSWALEQITKKEKIPIIVGGTGFYIDVLLGRMQTANVPPNPKLRKKLEKKHTKQLFLVLKKLDPARAKTIDKNNPRRLIRAIEIAVIIRQNNPSLILARPASGSEVSAFLSLPKFGNHAKKTSKSVQSYSVLWLGVQKSPTELKKRIHTRLLKRLPGIIIEVQRLHKNGLSWKRMNELGLEYRYVSLHVQGKLNYKLMTNKLQTAIWHYAKRQMTWFRRNKKIHWIKSEKEAQKLIKQFLQK